MYGFKWINNMDGYIMDRMMNRLTDHLIDWQIQILKDWLIMM